MAHHQEWVHSWKCVYVLLCPVFVNVAHLGNELIFFIYYGCRLYKPQVIPVMPYMSLCTEDLPICEIHLRNTTWVWCIQTYHLWQLMRSATENWSVLWPMSGNCNKAQQLRSSLIGNCQQWPTTGKAAVIVLCFYRSLLVYPLCYASVIACQMCYAFYLE